MLFLQLKLLSSFIVLAPYNYQTLISDGVYQIDISR